MDFYEVLDQVVDLLRSRQRVTYRTLKRQVDLDDTALEDLKEESCFAHPQIADEDGRGLVWTVDTLRSHAPRTFQLWSWNVPRLPTPHPIWRRRSSPPAVPSKASANKSLCCLLT